MKRNYKEKISGAWTQISTTFENNEETYGQVTASQGMEKGHVFLELSYRDSTVSMLLCRSAVVALKKALTRASKGR